MADDPDTTYKPPPLPAGATAYKPPPLPPGATAYKPPPLPPGATSARDQPTTAGGSWLGALGASLKHGATDLFYGGAQLGTRMGPEEGGAAFTDPADLAARQQTVDATVKAREEAYRKDPSVQAYPKTAFAGDLTGQIAAAVPLMVGAGAAPTLPARMIGAGVAAIPIGAARPVADTSKGDYGKQKAEQVAGEVAGSAIGQAVGEKVIVPVVKAAGRGVRYMLQNEEQRAATAATRAATKQTDLEQKAAEKVTAKVAEAQKSGLVPGDVIKEMAEAEEAGQPLTLMDVDPFPGSPIRRHAGSIYRGPGPAGRLMEQFQKDRTYGEDPETLRTWQGNRLDQLFLNLRSKLSSESAFQTGRNVAERRSTNAKPLFDEIRKGGSTAPLEHQFTKEFTAVTQAEGAAAQQLREAQTRLTGALSKQQTSAAAQAEAARTPAQLRTRETAELGMQATTGASLPEHPTSAWNPELSAAKSEFDAAQTELNRIRAVKEDVRTRLKQAQEDGTANAPGAVWSPRLQEFLDNPHVKKGLAEGWRRERDEALADGRPMNAREYAVVGTDEAGDPIVGKVPNMRLLMLAKQGIDNELLHGDGMYDQFGRKTDKFRVLDKLRRSFLGELDRLTDGKYAEARDQWAGETRIMQALRDGKEAFARPPRGLSPEEFETEWRDLSPPERDHFKLAAIDKLREDMDFSRLGGDQSRAMLNSPATRQKLRVMFGDTEAGKQEVNRAIRYITRERNMWQTGTSIMRGAQTADRLASDEQAKEEATQAALHAAHGFWHWMHGNVLAGANSMRRAASHIGWGEDPEKLNYEIARIYTNPSIERRIGPQGQLQIGPPPAVEPSLPYDPSKLDLYQEGGLDLLKAAGRGVPGRLPSSMYYSWPGAPPRP